MATVSELISQQFQVRREVSQTADLANLLIGRLKYNLETRQTAAIKDLQQKLDGDTLINVKGSKSVDFVQWLNRNYLIIKQTVRGVTYYPIHPALCLSINGEGPRVEGFINLLAETFSLSERNTIIHQLWDTDRFPAFEQMIYQLIDWQLPENPIVHDASEERFAGAPISGKTLTSEAKDLLIKTKEDLLSLVKATTGIQSFTVHAGRYLAFSLARFYLVQAGIELEVPIYAAPAADSHPGVRALAHESLELHRTRYSRVLKEHFYNLTSEAMKQNGFLQDPPDVMSARGLVGNIFHYNATVVSRDQKTYLQNLIDYDGFIGLAYHYYWSHSGAPSRFLRQLHAAQLNIAKKAGLANSRSRYSQWNFYWLAPSLIETLLIISQVRMNQNRILVHDLLRDWRQRYGIAVLIDGSWEEVYKKNFRSLGSPETLNDANQRRFLEILAERGRLRKNSDDFPWVILKD